MRKIVFALIPLLSMALAVPARSETAVRLRDINTRVNGSGSSLPRQMTVLGDRVVFAATEPSSGDEVWVSDGTPAGTTLLRDVCPGTCTSFPRILGVAGGYAFWLANAGEGQPTRLWRTDGTRAGTVPVQAAAGIPLEARSPYAFFQGRLYFSACTPDELCGLWRTDGTPAGTLLVVPGRDISQVVAASNQVFFTSPEGLWRTNGNPDSAVNIADVVGFPIVAAGNRVFFFGDSDRGPELWVSDGTPAGTRPLTDIQNHDPFPLYDSEAGRVLKAFGDHVYFIANDILHGHEIWRSDGTPETTRRVTDFGFFEPFDQYTSNADLEEVNGRLVFRATDGLTGIKLWVTDGRPELTAPIKDICPGGCGFLHPFQDIARAGNRVYFVANDREHGYELWSTDGTAAGTRLARDICPDPCEAEVSGLRPLLGAAFFRARSAGNFAFDLWRSDGTPQGTRPLTHFGQFEGPASFDFDAVAVGNRIFFTGFNAYGEELWVVDNRGTRVVADIARGEPGSDPVRLTPVGDRLFFQACEGQDRNVWVTAGTPESTVKVPAPAERCTEFPYTERSAGAIGLYFFLREDSARLQQLWVTDGTVPGTRQVTRLEPPTYLSSVLGELNGRAYFFVQREQDTEIWSTDGNPSATRREHTLTGVASTWYPARLDSPSGAEVYFFGSTPGNGVDVWRTDGTPAGTRRLAQDVRLPESSWFLRVGATVYFVAEDENFSTVLWKTDGTEAGTVPVLSFPQIPGELGLVKPVAHQGALYFFAANDGAWALWRSNGTVVGTGPVYTFDIELDPLFLPRFGLIEFAGRLFFAAEDGAHGSELWTSDGTTEGTRLLADLLPGTEGSSPSELTVAGGRLFFSASDGVRGFELWQTDGTAAGTRLVQDLAPQGPSSHPARFTATPSHLYFTADDGATGREIWALPLAGGNTCQPSPTRLCLGGRFQVEAVWRDFQGNSGTGKAVSLSADTGYFWFFDPANVETIVKVLDGRGVNEHHWVFYGALSNVEFSLTVTDVTTGLSRRYFNPINQFASVGDTRGFGPLGAFSRTPEVTVAAPSPLALVSERTDPAAAAAPCAPTATRLCLRGNRFAVEVAWRDFQGNRGTGKAVNLTTDTGYFWFFDAANVELVLKVLDGTPVNGHHWVFYGALTNVEYTITVTDTATGAVKTYENPSGRFASVGDTEAF